MPHDPVFLSYSHLHTFPRADEAFRILRGVAALVRPLMRARRWTVRELAEFYPDQPSLLGLNLDRGNTIFLRLRHPANPACFLSPEQIGDTLLHELAHIERGPHDAAFHALWNELRDEHWARMLKKSAGAGIHVQPPPPMPPQPHSSSRTVHHRPHRPQPDPLAMLFSLAFRPPPSRPQFLPPIPIFLCPPPPSGPSHRSRHGHDRPPATADRPRHSHPSSHHRHHHDRPHQKQHPAPPPSTAASCATANPSYTDQNRTALAQAATRRRRVHTTNAAEDGQDTANDAAIAQALWDALGQDEEATTSATETAAEAAETRWTCGACTLHNPDTYLCCGACGRARQPPLARSRSERKSKTSTSEAKTRSKKGKTRGKTKAVRFTPSTARPDDVSL